MSLSNTVQFLETIYQDEHLYKQVQTKTTFEEVARFATDLGFVFSEAEFFDGTVVYFEEHDSDLLWSPNKFILSSVVASSSNMCSCSCEPD